MWKIVALALAAASLAACASDLDRQLAAVRCQEVGISSNSVEYPTCLSAYTTLKREQVLNEAYRKTLNPAPYPRNIRHYEVF